MLMVSYKQSVTLKVGWRRRDLVHDPAMALRVRHAARSHAPAWLPDHGRRTGHRRGIGAGQVVVTAKVDGDLVRDVMEILPSLCARLYGRRVVPMSACGAVEAAREDRA
ncbi:hypothetical protein [Micromonospora coxensis]|uniref:hypothetical protein n=1 Tax=Micromonospora coxensis TaxID=356852 RepID=UPI003F55FF50